MEPDLVFGRVDPTLAWTVELPVLLRELVELVEHWASSHLADHPRPHHQEREQEVNHRVHRRTARVTPN